MTTKKWWISVCKSTLQIRSVAPILEYNEDFHHKEIEEELAISFIEGPHIINDYVVYYDGTELHLAKKEKSSKIFAPFFYTPAIISEKEKNPDILITINKSKITFSIKEEKVQYAMTLYSSLSLDKQKALFFISNKNDPNYLLETIKVNMMDLINKRKLTFDFNYDNNDVSIFTRKVFGTYGIKIK